MNSRKLTVYSKKKLDELETYTNDKKTTADKISETEEKLWRLSQNYNGLAHSSIRQRCLCNGRWQNDRKNAQEIHGRTQQKNTGDITIGVKSMTDNIWREGFKELVKNKDYTGVRYYLCTIIRDDPTFKTSEYQKAEKYLFENGMEDIYQPYAAVPGEPGDKDKSEWNEEYYFDRSHALIENFSRERLAHVKEVGEYVYRDKPTPGKEEALYNNIKNRLIKELNIDKKKIDRLRIVWNDGDNKDILKNNIMKAIKEII